LARESHHQGLVFHKFLDVVWWEFRFASEILDVRFIENKVKYLIKSCARFARGKANLEFVLGSQNCVFGKAAIGYD